MHNDNSILTILHSYLNFPFKFEVNILLLDIFTTAEDVVLWPGGASMLLQVDVVHLIFFPKSLGDAHDVLIVAVSLYTDRI